MTQTREMTQCHTSLEVLQCVAVCCCVLQCVAVLCSVLQCVAVCCSVLQCVAVSYFLSAFGSRCLNRHNATHRNTLQHTATHYNALPHAATRCNMPQQRVVPEVSEAEFNRDPMKTWRKFRKEAERPGHISSHRSAYR